MRDKLAVLIDRFLSTHDEKPAEVDKDIVQLKRIIDELILGKYGAPEDDIPLIDAILVNITTHNWLMYEPVIRWTYPAPEENIDIAIKTAMHNLGVAYNDIETLMDIKSYRDNRTKKGKAE